MSSHTRIGIGFVLAFIGLLLVVWGARAETPKGQAQEDGLDVELKMDDGDAVSLDVPQAAAIFCDRSIACKFFIKRCPKTAKCIWQHDIGKVAILDCPPCPENEK
jgi:hypothetical protein